MPSVGGSTVRGGTASFPEEKKKEMPLPAGSFSAVLEAHSWKRCGVKDETVLGGQEEGGQLTGIHDSWKWISTYLCIVFKESAE